MIVFDRIPDSEPYKKFINKYNHALEANQKAIEAIAISSWNANKEEVNSRFVNLKYINREEWIFFSNYESNKMEDFLSHDQVSGLFFWDTINTQIRIKAKISITSKKLSDAHFKNRTKKKNALAISSKQSREIHSYQEVINNYNKTLSQIEEKIQRPNYWGGFSLIPYYFEFWTGDKFRLNKREAYYKNDKQWKKSILQP